MNKRPLQYGIMYWFLLPVLYIRFQAQVKDICHWIEVCMFSLEVYILLYMSRKVCYTVLVTKTPIRFQIFTTGAPEQSLHLAMLLDLGGKGQNTNSINRLATIDRGSGPIAQASPEASGYLSDDEDFGQQICHNYGKY